MKSKIMLFLVLLSALCLDVCADLAEDFSSKDREQLEKYQKEEMAKDIKDVSFRPYILNMLFVSKEDIDLRNGLRLIPKLSAKHKLYFEKDVINAFINILKKYQSVDLNNQDFSTAFCFSMHAMASIRSVTIETLMLNLIDDPETWPKEIKEAVELNKNHESIKKEIRFQSLGALLSIKDEKSKDLLIIARKKVESLKDTKARKDILLKSVKNYEELSNGKNSAPNAMP